MFPQGLGDPGAVVHHAEAGLPRFRAKLQDHPASGVAQGVGEEVEEDLEGPVPVGPDPEGLEPGLEAKVPKPVEVELDVAPHDAKLAQRYVVGPARPASRLPG